MMKLNVFKKPIFYVVVVIILTAVSLSFCILKNIQDISTKKDDAKKSQKSYTNIDDTYKKTKIILCPDADYDITYSDMESARSIIETRLVINKLVDYDVSVNKLKKQIIITLPQMSDEDISKISNKLIQKGHIAFCAGLTNTNVILEGAADIKSAHANIDPQTSEPVVVLDLTETGRQKFTDATFEAVNSTTSSKYKDYTGGTTNSYVSIWMDDQMISAPIVNEVITSEQIVISSSNITAEDVVEIANIINSGELPFPITIYESSDYS